MTGIICLDLNKRYNIYQEETIKNPLKLIGVLRQRMQFSGRAFSLHVWSPGSYPWYCHPPSTKKKNEKKKRKKREVLNITHLAFLLESLISWDDDGWWIPAIGLLGGQWSEWRGTYYGQNTRIICTNIQWNIQ